jgi:pyruvate formate lyase activating enzyme
MIKTASHWKKLEGDKVQCELCPHQCKIPKGKKGICGVRENRDGVLYSLIYGSASSVAIDPIEKKPLFHFYPSSRVLSFGTVGCNLRCKHCQNYEISQASPEETHLREVTPQEAVELAEVHKCKSIAWTYNEPIIWHEYALDSMKLCKQAGIHTVYVTNGYIKEEPLEEIAPYLDAANVDVKAFNERFYREIVGGELEPVLETCRFLANYGVHLEVTYLLIPTLNDSPVEISKFCEWVANELGKDTPTHFTAFFPCYKLTYIPPTPKSTLIKAYEIAKSSNLNYPYLGNVPHTNYENTFCPYCKQVAIERYGFSVSLIGIKDGKCASCGKILPIKM